jgi:hypothetical protein
MRNARQPGAVVTDGNRYIHVAGPGPELRSGDRRIASVAGEEGDEVGLHPRKAGCFRSGLRVLGHASAAGSALPSLS